MLLSLSERTLSIFDLQLELKHQIFTFLSLLNQMSLQLNINLTINKFFSNESKYKVMSFIVMFVINRMNEILTKLD